MSIRPSFLCTRKSNVWIHSRHSTCLTLCQINVTSSQWKQRQFFAALPNAPSLNLRSDSDYIDQTTCELKKIRTQACVHIEKRIVVLRVMPSFVSSGKPTSRLHLIYKALASIRPASMSSYERCYAVQDVHNDT